MDPPITYYCAIRVGKMIYTRKSLKKEGWEWWKIARVKKMSILIVLVQITQIMKVLPPKKAKISL